MRSLSISYLCLQATREGQASYAHVHEIAGGMRNAGHEVRLFQPSYADAASRPSIPYRILQFARTQAQFAWSLTTTDVAYVRDHPAALPGIWLSLLAGVPVVLEVNGRFDELALSYPWTRRLTGVLGWHFRRRVAASSAVITVTPGLAEWIQRLTRHQMVSVVPNAANVDLFSPQLERPAGLPERYVVFFGALAEWHGVNVMLDALGSDQWPAGVSLVVAGGGGTMTGRVERAAERDPRLVYLGVVPYRDLPGIVSAAIAGLSPQNTAGGRYADGLSPLKVYEMLACGIPVIASDVPGMADLVRECGCGIVVPQDHSAALASAVSELAADSSLARRYGAKARSAVVSKHSWAVRVQDTMRILEQVLESDANLEPWRGREVVQLVGHSAKGGGVPVILGIAGVCQRIGLRPVVLASHPDVVAATLEAGCDVWRFEGIVREPRLAHDILTAVRLSRELRRRKTYIIHTHTSKGGFVGRLAGWLAGTPHIIHHTHGFFHSGLAPGPRRLMMVALETLFARLSHVQVLLNTDEALHAARDDVVPARRIRIVENGIAEPRRLTDDDCAATRLRWGVGERDVVIGTISRIAIEHKGLDTGMQAAKLLRAMGVEFKWVIVGDGEDRLSLEELAHRLGVEDCVTMAGHVDDAAPLFSCFDIVFAPSRREGQSISLIEAMALSRAIVSTDIPGNSGLLENDRSALLAAPDDAAGLASALAALASDAETRARLGREARRIYMERFTLDAFERRVEILYRELLSCE